MVAPETTPVGCPACGSRLSALSAGHGAHGCGACGGVWLDRTARLAETTTTSAGTARSCPWCGRPLDRVAIPGDSVVLDRCADHGTWLDRDELRAILDDHVATQLVRELIGVEAQLEPAQRVELLATIDKIRAAMVGATTFSRAVFQPRCHPDRVTLGMGNVFMGGIAAVGPEGNRSLVDATSMWIVPGLLLAVAALVDVSILVLGGTGIGERITIGIVSVLFVVIAIGSLAAAIRARRRRLVIDARSRTCNVLDGDRMVVSIPVRLVYRTWIQVYASPGYSDNFHVLVDLGMAELWLAQSSDETQARDLAATVARYLGVKCDPLLHRKG